MPRGPRAASFPSGRFPLAPPVSPLSLAVAAIAVLLAAVVWLAITRRRLAAQLAATRRRFLAGMDQAPSRMTYRVVKPAGGIAEGRQVIRGVRSAVLDDLGLAAASVEIRRTPDEVRLSVSDRGGGFDVESARKRGFGLVGMTERMKLADGVCTIESEPGVGSRISAWLPIVKQEPRRPASARRMPAARERAG